MKKTKTEKRVENAYSAFLDNETLNEPLTMAFSGNREIAQILPSEQLSQKADKYFGLFKKICSFLPGILFLHLAMPATIEFGFGIWSLFWLAAGIFMIGQDSVTFKIESIFYCRYPLC